MASTVENEDCHEKGFAKGRNFSLDTLPDLYWLQLVVDRFVIVAIETR